MNIDIKRNGFSLFSDNVSFGFYGKRFPFENNGIYTLDTVGEIPVSKILKGGRNTSKNCHLTND